MRLSDAIALGRHLIALNSSTWHGKDNSGCAICMGFAAIGKLDEWDADREARFKYWPWLRGIMPDTEHATYSAQVGHLAFKVEIGEMSLDQLIDWVRSVEPNEDASESAEEFLETVRVQAATAKVRP